MAVRCEPPYDVRIGPGVLAELDCHADPAAAFVLADERVFELHGARLGALGGAARLLVAPGEQAKSLAQVERVLDALVAARCDRGSCLVTFGGGVVGDLGGLCAALYLRGIALVHCPTTLLAQVDASVGGKSAVNLAGGKNLAGAFHQPRAVLCDTSVLATLCERELRSGLGEILKTALVAGEADLAELERHCAALAERCEPELAAAIERAVLTKARIVALDPLESGPRAELNLGHTFAHAIEHAAGYGRVPHGAAVAVGLALALRASAASGRLEDPALPERSARLARRLGLPARLSDLGVRLDPAAIIAAMSADKKGRAGNPRFVLPRRAGLLERDVALDPKLLGELLAAD